jgi:hypothetical protein
LCSSRFSRKVTVLTAAGALCLAATGTAAAVTRAAPSAPPAQAADMLSFHSLIRSSHAGPAQLTAQVSLARQAVFIEADRAAHAAAVAAARAAAIRAAARAAAIRAAAARAAAARAAAERAAAQRAAAQQAAAQQAAAQQAAAQRAAAQRVATEAAASQAPSGAPQQIAEQMLAQYGWAGQFSCLDSLWAQESGWNLYAENPSSGAYGIPQALPGSKMASAGSDWESDAATQISWGLGYIRAMYGSPCAAWGHEEAADWY